MKTKDEVMVEGRPVVYSILFNPMKKAALELGWMLTVHGSMHSDLDLIAIPWTDDAKPHQELVKALSDCLGPTIWKDYHFKEHIEKPHGRIVYTLSIFTDWYIDLSIIPIR